MKLSGCILTKNEENNIAKCLGSISNICDEIIIIDSHSIDATVEIAKEFTNKIYYAEFQNDFSKLRNYGISKCTGDYILMLDGDEALDLKDCERLLNFLSSNPTIDGIYFKINQYYRVGSPDEDMAFRLFKNCESFYYDRAVNEEIISSIIKTNSSPTFFASDYIIHHYGYDVSDPLNRARLDRNFDIIDECPLEERDRYFFYTLGNQFLRINMYLEAIDAYETSLKSNSTTGVIDHYISLLVLNLLKCYIKTRSFDKGNSLYYKFKEKLYDCKDFCFMAFISCYETGDFDEAIKLLDILRIDGFSKTLYPCNHYYESNNIDMIEENISNELFLQKYPVLRKNLPLIICIKCNSSYFNGFKLLSDLSYVDNFKFIFSTSRINNKKLLEKDSKVKAFSFINEDENILNHVLRECNYILPSNKDKWILILNENETISINELVKVLNFIDYPNNKCGAMLKIESSHGTVKNELRVYKFNDGLHYDTNKLSSILPSFISVYGNNEHLDSNITINCSQIIMDKS